MDKEMKLMEMKAKKLVGNKVNLTLRKKPSLGMEFNSFSMIAFLDSVNRCILNITKETGMSYSIPLKDDYFVVENIETTK